MLEQLEVRCPELMERVDLIAGTSTGAVIALLLATGASPTACREMYETMVPKVFGRPRSMYARFLSAKYDSTILKECLKDYFGGTTLGRLSKRVVVPALRVDGAASTSHAPEFFSSNPVMGGWRPAVFTNLPAITGARPDVDLSAVDAALRSAAAPTFFPAYQGYADGGLFANNPSVVALGKTLLHLPHLRRSDIRVLSLGTGAWPKRVVTSPDMGLAQWSPYLLDLLLDASNLSSELSMTYLMKSRYCRLDPHFDFHTKEQQPVALDDANALRRLVRLGRDADLDQAIHFLERHIFQTKTPQRQRGEKRPAHQAVVDPILMGGIYASSSADFLEDEDEDDDFTQEDDRKEEVFSSAPRLHAHQWAALVDQAWIDEAAKKKSWPPPSSSKKQEEQAPQSQQHHHQS